jgi:replicative superfamily II helicase
LELDGLVKQFISLGLLEEEGEDVRLTLLGRACGRSSLSFDSALRLVELVRGRGASIKSAEEVMAIVQSLPESDGGFTPIVKKGRGEASRPSEASSRYGWKIVELLQRFADDAHDYLKRCKRASILWDWIEGVPVEEIERRYSQPFGGMIGRGDVSRFSEATRFHLRAAHEVLSVLFVTGGPSDASIEMLLDRLEFGLPAGAMPLTKLSVPLTRGEYLALSQNGFASVDAVLAASDDQLASILSPARASAIAAVREAATAA